MVKKPTVTAAPEVVDSVEAFEAKLAQVREAQKVFATYTQEQVDEKTPPTILLLSDDDTVVPVENSLLYYEALHQHKIPAALYLFPNGGHGWGTQDYFLYKKEAKELIYLWLKHNEIIK